MISETEIFLQSRDPMKHKIKYIAGNLSKNYTGDKTTVNVSSEFLYKLNSGELSIPIFSNVFIIHSVIRIQTLKQTSQIR